jgi:hypothetical protein
MKVSTKTQADAIEIYKIIEQIRSPADMDLIARRKRKRTSNPNREVKPQHCAPIIAPIYPPTEQRSKGMIDSGASVTMLSFKDNYVTNLHQVETTTLQGIAGGCDVEGIGTVSYHLPRPNTQCYFPLHPVSLTNPCGHRFAKESAHKDRVEYFSCTYAVVRIMELAVPQYSP